MQVRHSTSSDLQVILNLIDEARGIMRSEGNTKQWPVGYPKTEQIEKDIEQGHSFIIEDEKGKVIGTFAFIVGIDPTYLKIYNGQWKDDTKPYATIHRIASGPDSHGIAETCISWAKSQIDVLRIDTHEDNHIMQHIIAKHGFEYCGIIHLMNGDERLAYQWIR